MRKLLQLGIAVALTAAAVLLPNAVNGQAEDLGFRVDWGGGELGRALEQDVVVFDIHTLRIIKPTQRDHRRIVFRNLVNPEDLRWALVENFPRMSLVHFGPIPEPGNTVNIKSILAKGVPVLVENIPCGVGNSYLYRREGDELNPLFCAVMSGGSGIRGSDSLIPAGDYILAVKLRNEDDVFALKKMTVTQGDVERLRKIDDEKSEPNSGKDPRSLNLEWSKLEDAESQWHKLVANRVPTKSPVLSVLALSYYQDELGGPDETTSWKYREVIKQNEKAVSQKK